MIEVDHLTLLRGGRTILDRVHLRAHPGEIVGLLGPNGAGKTSLVQILCGVFPPTSGTIRILGHDLLDQPHAARRQLGYAPETPPLYPEMSVRDLLRFAADLHGTPHARSAVQAVVEAQGLGEVASRPCGRLSQGWRRRVGIAAALVHQPPVLILDEPTTGLDPLARQSLREDLARWAQDGRTVVLSTHEIAEAEACCDRVVVLRSGQVVAHVDLRQDRTRHIRLVVERPSQSWVDAIRRLPGVTEVEAHGDALEVRTDQDLRATLAEIATPYGLIELSAAQDLQRIFLRASTGAST